MFEYQWIFFLIPFFILSSVDISFNNLLFTHVFFTIVSDNNLLFFPSIHILSDIFVNCPAELLKNILHLYHLLIYHSDGMILFVVLLLS